VENVAVSDACDIAVEKKIKKMSIFLINAFKFNAIYHL
jgi:hypothetical protein